MTTNPLPDHLARLGESLDRAFRADLAARPLRRGRPWQRRRFIAVALVALAVPAAAYAAHELISPGQVAASLPQGTKALIGTDPTCTVVKADIEYHCVLAGMPTSETPAATAGSSTTASSATAWAWITMPDGKKMLVKASSEPALEQKIAGLTGASQGRKAPVGHDAATTADQWTGAVEPTVDAAKHVNGGCRAQNAAGTEWECYIGEAAVDQHIISQGFLGQYAPTPGVG